MVKIGEHKQVHLGHNTIMLEGLSDGIMINTGSEKGTMVQKDLVWRWLDGYRHLESVWREGDSSLVRENTRKMISEIEEWVLTSGTISA